ncbi:hypothetical protein ACHWQZ_G002608 [Mnemiopsis leidyi]
MTFYTLTVLIVWEATLRTVLTSESDQLFYDHQKKQIVLVGVFDISRDDCSTPRTFGNLFQSHFKSYVAELNNNTSNLKMAGQDTVMKFRAEVVDSCSSTVTGSRGIMQKIFDPAPTSDCSVLPHGFIGPGANNQMRSVLDMTSAFNITHTSYGIMESDIIDPVDPERYPFFRNVRTSARVMIKHVCRLVEALSWHYVSISVTSHSEHNLNLCEEFYVDMSVSVYLKGDIAKGVKELTTPFKELQDTNPPLVTIMLGDMQLIDIERFHQILSQNVIPHSHIWLISEQFLLAYIDLYGRLPQYPDQKFICYHSPPNKTPNTLKQDHCFGSKCSLAQNVSQILKLTFFISLGVDEIVTKGSVGAPQGKSDNVELFFLDSSENTLVKVAQSSTGENMKVEVKVNETALHSTGIRELGPSICSPGCGSGQTTFRRAGEPTSCFHCKNCFLLREVSNGSTAHCTECSTSQKPNVNNSDCVDIELEPHLYRTRAGAVLIVLSLFGILSVFLTSVVFVKNKTTPIIRAANRELCYVIFLGLILCFTSVFLMVLPPGQIICKLQISLLSLGASLTITTILGRAVRIIRIFTATNVTIETFLVSLRHQAFFISGIVLLQTGLAVLATAGTGPNTRVEYDERTRQLQIEQPRVHAVCESPDQTLVSVFLAVFLGLCVVTSVISFQARKLPTNYNEVTYTYFTVFTMDIILVSFLAIFYTADQKQNNILTAAIITIITSYLVLFMLFFNKVYIIYFSPDQNKIHNIPESPTLKFKRHRRESTRLVPSLVTSPSLQTIDIKRPSYKF